MNFLRFVYVHVIEYTWRSEDNFVVLSTMCVPKTEFRLSGFAPTKIYKLGRSKGDMDPQLRVLRLFPSTQTIPNASCRGSETLFWPL